MIIYGNQATPWFSAIFISRKKILGEQRAMLNAEY